MQITGRGEITPAMVYLQNAGICYIRELLNNYGAKQGESLPESAPGFDVASFSNDLPPILGVEYWSDRVLTGGLAKLYTALHKRLLQNPQQILAEYVRCLNPEWKP